MRSVVIALLVVLPLVTLSPSVSFAADGFHILTAAAQATSIVGEMDNSDDDYHSCDSPPSFVTNDRLDSIATLVCFHPICRAKEFHQGKLPIFKLHANFRI
jgi:hypothetical protein